MKFNVGDFIKIRKNYETDGCDLCHQDLTYWQKHPVEIVATHPERLVVKTRHQDNYRTWYILPQDAIKFVLNLENK